MIAMADQLDPERVAQLTRAREQRLEQLVKEKEQEEALLKSPRFNYQWHADILKVVSAGNAAGVLAAGAAIDHFANRPDIQWYIKLAGLFFFVGVFCFPIGLFLVIDWYLTARNAIGAFVGGQEADASVESDTTWKIRAVFYLAMVGAAVFLIGSVLALIILLRA
jgi:hypothetical protein